MRGRRPVCLVGADLWPPLEEERRSVAWWERVYERAAHRAAREQDRAERAEEELELLRDVFERVHAQLGEVVTLREAA